ncbi:MAG: hypothetical protein J1E36_02945, partial [Eubacterium sp.]|nr:hypothetical protein [Eubacterium sp.]
QGRITEDDFLSEQERMMKYSGYNMNNQYQQGYYAPNDTVQQSAQYQPYQAPQQNYINSGTFYTPDFSPIQQYPPYDMSQPYQQQGGSYYYTPQPPQNEQPVQPTEPTQYYNPVEPAHPTEPQYYTPPSEETSENTETDNNNE